MSNLLVQRKGMDFQKRSLALAIAENHICQTRLLVIARLCKGLCIKKSEFIFSRRQIKGSFEITS
ncbi:MAG TPA: hypothetical protein DD377_02425 [Firmicutes bacterium]|nr:hypothetical protein [Bacillota bacterium]